MEEMRKAEQAREERRKQATQRKADEKSRLNGVTAVFLDTETYGESSQLLEAQEGNIYDVETGEYDPTFNKEGTDETISNDGIDQFGANEDDGSGGNTFTLDIVKDDNTAGTATFNGGGVN
tara:strand:+ start:131 stop:493 length:363 start_codon:yes stop_codon:yes gene_type:complete